MPEWGKPTGMTETYFYRNGRKENLPVDPTTPLPGKKVLVTGANTGLGLEAAIKFAQLGVAKLILGVRTPSKGEEAKRKIIQQSKIADEDVLVLQVDYGTFDSVTNFVKTLKTHVSELDFAVLNAGIAMSRYQQSSQGYEMSIQVNCLSTSLLSIELLPLLRASKSQPPVLEIVSSLSYCAVTPQMVEGVSKDGVGWLEYFSRPENFSMTSQYFVSKISLMFAEQGIRDSLGNGTGKRGPDDPILVTSCPGMCVTEIQRDFNWFITAVLKVRSMISARTAEQGSRTLVSAVTRGEESHGKMWMNDTYDDRSPMLSEELFRTLQEKAWKEIWNVLKGYNNDIVI